MDKELQNYTFFLAKKPIFLISVFVFLYKSRNKIFEKFLRTFFGKAISTNPSYLEKIKRVDTLSDPRVTGKVNLDNVLKYQPGEVDSFFSCIKLAGKKYCFTKNINWEEIFEDNEDYSSLHRWNWLLFKLTETRDYSALREWAKYHISDWIARYDDKIDKTLKWSTYTTGERICNMIIFMEKTSMQPNDVIKKALSRMVSHLYNNLEYYGPCDSFNHIINNARALYFYGTYFNQQDYVTSANEILKNELPRLITSDGFLREGSSHYQFLFTRWLLEILYMGQKYSDLDVISYLAPYAKKLIEKCWFFLVFDKSNSQWRMPLFGDISPDCTPEWLMDLPQSSLATSLYNPSNKPEIIKKNGWSSIFENGRHESSNLREFQDKDESIQVFAESGWYRFDFLKTTLFLHAEPEGIPSYPTHSHRDMSSFCMYREGKEVLIDSGRSHYIDDKEGEYGISSQSHNSVQIDELDPYPDRKYSGVWKTICKKPVLTWLKEKETLQIKIKHFGFNRIYNDKVYHQRIFKLFSTHMIVEDYFEGSNEHLVNSFFHWAEGLEIAQSKIKEQFIVKGSEEKKYIFKYEVAQGLKFEKHFGNHENFAGWHFPEYGQRIPIGTLKSEAKVAFPFRQRFIIEWD